MIRLKLYVTGHTASGDRARVAVRDLERRVQALSGESCVTEVVDVLEDPESAARDSVFATPTLIRCGSTPVRLFGDLSSAEKLMRGLKLDTRPVPRAEAAIA